MTVGELKKLIKYIDDDYLLLVRHFDGGYQFDDLPTSAVIISITDKTVSID